MKSALLLLVLAPLATAAPQGSDYSLDPLPPERVEVEGGFWGPRLRANREVTLPHVLRMCEQTGRVRNFEVAGGLAEGEFEGFYFNDSDFYKAIEAASYLLADEPDPALDARLDELIAKIAAAQEPDGYLYTSRTICSPDNMPPGGKERWSDIGGGHELYCSGHLFEAAVAHFQATGKRSLLDVATRNADLLCEVFGPEGHIEPPGHPEIELALARLYRVTGEQRYLDLARFLLEARGQGEGRPRYGEYAQDHLPVLEQQEAVGHAVRAAYLYAGMMDVGALSGEPAYARAAERLWQDVVSHKLYLTGGIGARGGGEAFGAPFELPNRSAYAETCAAIANILWNQRMFLRTGDARYVDVLERTLYNGFLAGVSLSGDRFFYPNPLESHDGGTRSDWFGCACCPPNVARLLASLPGYVYAFDSDEVRVNLFVQGEAEAHLEPGKVRLRQETRYPWDGRVTITVEPDTGAGDFDLLVRIPGWARGEVLPGDLYSYLDPVEGGPSLRVAGEPVALELQQGYVRLSRRWKAGDRVELELPMVARRVVADPRVKDDLGRRALVRGPIVYCAEAVDQPDGNVLGLVLPDEGGLEESWQPDLLGGVVRLRAEAQAVRRDAEGQARTAGETALTAVPYYAWANRERGQMAVWLAGTIPAAKPLPGPTIAHRAEASASFGGSIAALSDQLEPTSSIDHANPFWHCWPHKGTQEWVQYDLAEPTRVAGVEVYWFDDTGIGECRLPASWRLLAKVGGEWHEVEGASGYGVEADRYNRTTFEPVLAEGLRVEMQLAEGFATGLHEWRVLAAGARGAVGAVGAQSAPRPADAMGNGSFEQAEGDRPTGWSRVTWGGAGRLEHATVGRTGPRSVLLASERGGDLSWTTTVPVEPFARYRLSGWIRTEGVAAGSGRGALLNLHDMQPLATPALTGTNDWTLVELEFETEDRDAVQVNCLLGGWGFSTGQAWYDDLALVLLERQPQPEPFITVHAEEVGEPISEYVYGQFIEHLGRCIQGGIWAEMLDDRKFFHAVGSDGSPWELVGPADALTMSREEPFVGEHTPELELRGGGLQGLQQGGLAFQEGRDYEGYVWLAGPVEGGRVTVMIGGPTASGTESFQSVRVLSHLDGEWQKVPLAFVAGSERDDGRLIVVSDGRGRLRVGTASLMPADNVEGMRADTLELLRRLDSPVYRWPGGNFVSGYDWRDGIGDRDRRPPRKNPAWQGVEPNDFGLDEFLAFCRELGTEPYIAINTGLGSVESAVDELRYANAPADTPLGAQRAANGHPEPYGVRFWGVGNEMYGGWQLGHVPLEQYIPRHNAFVEALRAADPSIELVAVGAVGPWSEGMMRECADHMDLVSEHFYCQERSGLRAHVRQIPDAVRQVAEAHRRYREEIPGLEAKDIRIALDEWNYWYGPHVFGELGTRYFLKDGLGIAAGLNEMARHSDLFYMANYAQTVNVIGAIKTSRTSAAMETTGLVLELYRHRFGTLPARTESASPLDAQAAWSADRKTLTLAVVHPALTPAEVPLEVRGARLTGTGTCYVMAGDDPQAFNDPDAGSPVVIEQRKVSGLTDTLSLPPCSVTLWVLDVE